MIFCHNETILIKDVAFMSLCVQYFHIMTKIHIMASWHNHIGLKMNEKRFI